MQCATLARLHGPSRPVDLLNANAAVARWLAYLSCEAGELILSGRMVAAKLHVWPVGPL